MYIYIYIYIYCIYIGGLLHFTKNSLSSPCTSQHKHERKDRTLKTLAESPDLIYGISLD